MRWAGSKKWLIPRIRNEVVGSRRYVEPFLGSGSVFLNMDPHVPCLGGDENEELVVTFREVRDRPDQVMQTFNSFANTEDGYLEVRSMDRSPSFFNQEGSVRAARLLFLNQTCFNGLYRVNGRGEFNVPYGRRNINVAEFEKRLMSVSGKLKITRDLVQSENILREDFRKLLLRTVEGDFVYLDPPYLSKSGKGGFVGYTAGGFEPGTHQEILQWMAEVSKFGVRALLSNGRLDELEESAKQLGLSVETFKVHRSISASVPSRGLAEELLIANF